MALGPANGITGFMLTTVSGVTAVVSQISQNPAQLCILAAGNINPNPRFLKFFDTAVANSGAGMQAAYQFIIPGNTAGAGSNLPVSGGPPVLSGLQFSQGLAVAITQNPAMADASGISGVNECFAVIGWR